MKGTRFGIFVAQAEPYPVLTEKWRYFDELGFDGIWHPDHFLRPSDPTGPLFEGWTSLAAVATQTSRIRVGVMVSSNLLRHPALLAQQAITVDHISEGRLELGIGCGWFVEEHRRFRIPLPEPRVRVDRFSEALEIIDPLLRGETVSYEGRHYQLSEARLRPLPVQSPRPPFTLGAHRPRMLRILDGACERIGRDPAEIIRSVHVGVSNMVSQGLPDVWSSADAFSEVVGSTPRWG